MNDIKVKKTTYIIAWLLMSVLIKIYGVFIELLFMSLAIDPHFLIRYMWLIDAINLILSTTLIFYLVYFKLFKNLNPKKVLVYLYTFGSIAVLLSIGKTVNKLEEIGILNNFDAFTYSWSISASWIMTAIIIRQLVFGSNKYIHEEKADIENPKLHDS
jgi:hypothetical protein